MAKRGVKLGSKRGHYKPRVLDDYEKYLRARKRAEDKGYLLTSEYDRKEFESEYTNLKEDYPLRSKQQIINDIVDSQKPFDYWEARRLETAIKKSGGIGQTYVDEDNDNIKINIKSYKDIIGLDKDQRRIFFSVLVNDLGYTYREAESIYEG